MLELLLDEINSEYVQYKFFPTSNHDDYGIVRIDRETLKRKLIKDCQTYSSSKGMAWRCVEHL